MLIIELFCGAFGWSVGALELGAHAIGFDIEHLPHHGKVPDGAELVLQDVLTLRGRQFKNAQLIVASPPCQKYSWLAMPWSRSKSDHSKAAKALRKEWETNGPDNRLFNACFEIQKDACRAAGRYIPMVVENVRGAQEWVGPAKAKFGSFYLWGDVAMVGNRIVAGSARFGNAMRIQADPKVPGFRFDGSGGSFQSAAVNAVKVPSESGRRTDVGNGARFTSRDCGIEAGNKIGGDWFSDSQSTCRKHGSKSRARKAASARIARIPLELSRYVARSFLAGSAVTATLVENAGRDA